MARRHGLTEFEILEYLENISPIQSSNESGSETSTEEDDDFVPAETAHSSDSEESNEHPAESDTSDDDLPLAQRVRSTDSTRGRERPSRRQANRTRDAGRGLLPGRRRGEVIGQLSDEVANNDADPGVADDTQDGDSTVVDAVYGAARGGRGRGALGARRDAAARRGPGRGGAVHHPLPGEVVESSNGTKWTRIDTGDTAGWLNAQNVLRETPGPTGHAKRHVIDDSSLSALRLFVSGPILKLVKKYTEEKAHNKRGNNEWTLSLEELDAFTGLLYARRAYGARGISYKDLWSNMWGSSFFQSTMSRNRFVEICSYLRFDYMSSRRQRKESDQFCLASEIWNLFTENCIACYKPGKNMTVDEQLYSCKCRCPFIQYMPNNPDKYGIKYWLLCDADKRYFLNGFPYLGNDETRDPSKSQEVPPAARSSDDSLYATHLYKSGDNLLIVYQGKKRKNVLVLSNMHAGCQVNENTEKKLPETVNFYNETKCGVDVIDQMTILYSVRARTRRWPVHVFYNILDLAMINAHTIFKLLTCKKISLQDFILKVADELAGPYKLQRGANLPLQALGTGAGQHGKRKRCQIQVSCKIHKGNKTSSACFKCNKYVCKSCPAQTLVECLNCETIPA